ncbi:MAG: hypothetical protein OEW17_10615 [Gemmatimonadota bacterium]|nr:hypothetical protein [Gemmatimonadota bacterium]MDH4349250.1 hypothetical protein [Gemmatimonadota bacterium]MDH5284159.1 hypothetical protein [Gemmatimonadota bacterium]
MATMNRRPLLSLGMVLLVGGGFVLARGATYTTKETLFKVGGWKPKVEERRTVPPWVGGMLALAGVALIVAAARRPS